MVNPEGVRDTTSQIAPDRSQRRRVSTCEGMFWYYRDFLPRSIHPARYS